MRPLVVAVVGLLALVAVPSCSCDGVGLTPAPKCIEGETRACGLPGCAQDGVQLCADDAWSDCSGYSEPAEEVCDGLDNDCDGRTDESDPHKYEVCGTGAGTCSPGIIECQNGFNVCVGGKGPEKEVCDGQDNDCDGAIDNGVEEEVCYSLGLDHYSRGEGICHGGVTQCVAGESVCSFEQLPEEEVCNGVDDDCDGVVDDGVTPEPVDLLLVIDRSCSMSTAIGNVLTAVTAFSNQAPAQLRMAIMSTAGPGNDGRCKVEYDFDTAPNIASQLPPVWGVGGGSEATLDCVYLAVHSSNLFNLSWSPGVRREIVLITDENCQSGWCSHQCSRSLDPLCLQIVAPEHVLLPQETAQLCYDNRVIVDLVSPGTFVDNYYSPLYLLTGGRVLRYSTNLGDDLTNTFKKIACL